MILQVRYKLQQLSFLEVLQEKNLSSINTLSFQNNYGHWISVRDKVSTDNRALKAVKINLYKMIIKIYI